MQLNKPLNVLLLYDRVTAFCVPARTMYELSHVYLFAVVCLIIYRTKDVCVIQSVAILFANDAKKRCQESENVSVCSL